MRVRLVVIGGLLAFMNSCTFVDYSMWKFDAKRMSNFDSTRISFRTDGFYSFKKEQGRTGGYRDMVFYKNGYFAEGSVQKIVKLGDKEECRSNIFLKWGRYEIEGSNLFIQYFGYNSIAGGGPPIRHWKVVELYGNVLNDTTIFFRLRKSQRNGHFEDTKIDRTYRFVQYDSLPPSDNWLMDEFKEK